MSEANTRGEVTIDLDGFTYLLRPSFEAIQAIEDKTGTGIIALVAQAGEGNMTLRTAAIITAELIRAWGREAGENAEPHQRDAAKVNPDKVGQLIHEAGIAAVLPRLTVVLTAAATGGVTRTGEWKAARPQETHGAA